MFACFHCKSEREIDGLPVFVFALAEPSVVTLVISEQLPWPDNSTY